MDLIHEVERRFPVDHWRVGDLHVWPIIRHQMGWYFDSRYDLKREDAGGGHPTARRWRQITGFGVNLARFTRASLVDRRHNASVRGSTDVVVLGDSASRIWLEGHWYDRLCEPVVEALGELGMTCLHLEPTHLYRTPRHNQARFIQPAIDREWFNTRHGPREGVSGSELDQYPEFEAFLRSRQLEVAPFREAWIRRQARFTVAVANHFGSIFDRVGAIAGVLVDYAIPQMAFNHACRQRSIPSIELQHGVQGELHAAYGEWSRLPDDGYSLLPSVYWTWSELEASTIHRWTRPVSEFHRPVVGGNPWLDQWRGDPGGVVRQQDDKVSRLMQATDAEAHILLTLQAGVTSEQDLRIFRAAIERTPSWHWHARLHPSMTSADIVRVSATLDPGSVLNVEIESADRRPLYAWLRHVDAHVTVCSTTVIEAETFGVPSVATGVGAPELFPAESASGSLMYATTAADLVHAVRAQLKRASQLRSERSSRSVSVSTAGVLQQILTPATK